MNTIFGLLLSLKLCLIIFPLKANTMHQQKEDTNSYPTTLTPNLFYETNVAKLLHQPIVMDFNTSIGQ